MLEAQEAKDRQQNSYLATNFNESLQERFRSRRNPVINTLVLYLSNHDVFKNKHPLELTTKAAAVRFGIETFKRLFGDDEQPAQGNSSDESSQSSTTVHQRLKMSIGSVQEGNLQRQESLDPTKKIFDLYDRQQFRGPKLNQLFNALMTIQPTSTQSERNFSLAAGIATTKRLKLTAKKLNALSFLKSYFKNKN